MWTTRRWFLRKPRGAIRRNPTPSPTLSPTLLSPTSSPMSSPTLLSPTPSPMPSPTSSPMVIILIIDLMRHTTTGAARYYSIADNIVDAFPIPSPTVSPTPSLISSPMPSPTVSPIPSPTPSSTSSPIVSPFGRQQHRNYVADSIDK